MKIHPLLTRPRATALVMALALGWGPGGFLSVGQALAAPQTGSRDAMVTLNFVNAEIEGVARAMAAILNRQILVDPRVKGTITLYSDQPMSTRAAYQNFLAALRGQGFSMVDVAGLLKIVPEAEAKLQTGTVDVGTVRRSGDQVLTQIFRLQNENANNLVSVLRPLISPNNTINANPASNTLVITDYADNLQRIGQMIAALDVPTSTDLEAIPLQHAVAVDLAPVVQRLADGGGAAPAQGAAAAGATLVMADARTNTLMVRAASPARLSMVRSLVQRLDRPGQAGVGGSGIHVVYLKNADAVKMAQVLRAAYPGAGGSGGGGTASSSTGAGAGGRAGGNAMGGANTGGSGSGSSQTTSPVAASAEPSTGGFIQADPSTNSLIITASEAQYRQLRAVIDQLDGRRAQIYIEAMIVKVDAEKAASLGVQWAGGAGDKTLVGAGANFTGFGKIPALTDVLASAADSAVPALNGFNVALARRLSDGTISLGALATFLQTEAGGNILSTPNLVTLDNEEAKIVVGENVPFVTGSFTNTGSNNGSVNPFQTVERKDVGLTLRVRPQVGEGGAVRMTIFQEDARVSNATANAANGPTTSKSSIETTVVVDDGEVLVLGGLMKDEYGDGQSKVPLLGDIPYLGNLFKSQERSRKKTSLMVFLRPIVMRNQDSANALTLDRYDYMRQRQMESQPKESVLLPINDAPLLDPLKISSRLTMPSPSQPLDDPDAPVTHVLMPGGTGYEGKLAPVRATAPTPAP
ncbi:MAG: type II secretion system secretin GspD [Aquabacterium sp.]|jgi:general secretion pathway protein D|uniref:type II secretion system secretin GspD n=1 Tax=Aquabacterium sp. TaxID=1872578 RepID=UPI001B6235C5|nr:type II secretion system secretin GspD [Aquabacterium sp.]MBP7131962.1 type II secretion system secretin GspD [Aquabacterium sp.]MBP9063270.1 type II secretion system secretin GspD [Aquabacterium sp.]